MTNKIAIFDVDGTLIDSQSQQLFLKYMRRKNLINFIAYFRIMVWFILYKLGLIKNPKEIMDYAFSFLNSFEDERISKLVNDFFTNDLKAHLFPDAVALVKKHQENGDQVFLVSNALEYIVKEIGRYLNIDIDNCIGTKLEVKDGLLTGHILGDMVYSSNKITVIRSAFERNQVVPEETWGYSDHISDIELLKFVDHPTAVNPDRQLKEEFETRGWPIVQFKL